MTLMVSVHHIYCWLYNVWDTRDKYNKTECLAMTWHRVSYIDTTYSFAFRALPESTSVAAAAARTVVPRSLTLVSGADCSMRKLPVKTRQWVTYGR